MSHFTGSSRISNRNGRLSSPNVFRAIARFLAMTLLLTGSLVGAQDGIGVGMGFDVENILPQRFRDPGDKTRAWFPVKYVCGETQPSDRLVQGTYATLINVLNLSKFKVRIGWWFSPGPGAGILGAQAEIPSHGSLYMDCPFIIRNLLLFGVNVGSFIEGFVSIEDLSSAATERTPTRVTAVYSSLHKQVHNLPDLLPRQTERSYCQRDAQGRLIVTIRNQGEADAPASTTRIALAGGEAFDRSTPALTVGAEANLEPVPIPRSEGTLVFTITADAMGVIREMNEPNNTAIGTCLIIL
jgi:hypothetical protein